MLNLDYVGYNRKLNSYCQQYQYLLRHNNGKSQTTNKNSKSASSVSQQCLINLLAMPYSNV